MSDQQPSQHLSQTLEALARNPDSQTRVVAQHLVPIELAIKNGVRLARIHEALCADGLKLSYRGFTTALKRCRKAARHLNSQRPALPVAKPGDPVESAAPALPAKAQSPPTSSSLGAASPAVDSPTARKDDLCPPDILGAREVMKQLRAEGVLPPAKKFNEG